MNTNDIFNAFVRRDAVLKKCLLKVARDTICILLHQQDQTKEEFDEQLANETADLRMELKTTSEQLLRAQRQRERRNSPYNRFQHY